VRRRGVLTLVAAALCAVLAACSSGGGTAAVHGGGSSPTKVATAYFSALMLHHRAVAHRLVCASGWQGARSFTFATFSFSRHPSPRAYLRTLQPRSRHIAGGWLVAFERERGPGSLPLFRVVQDGGRYFVCGFVKR